MKALAIPSLGFAALLLCAPAHGQAERGNWRAMSTTAHGVTGDIVLTDTRIVLNFSGFTLAQIRELTPAEAAAPFSGEDTSTTGSGNLYRTSIPAEKRFAHKNTLCGSEETQWVVSYLHGKTLQLAFFSGATMPVLKPEAIANTTSLCGTYEYTR